MKIFKPKELLNHTIIIQHTVVNMWGCVEILSNKSQYSSPEVVMLVIRNYLFYGHEFARILFTSFSWNLWLAICTYAPMHVIDQVPVVQRVDNFIHWIGRYPADEMCARFSR